MTEDLGWVGLEVRPEVNATSLGSQLGRGLSGPLDGAGRSAGRRFGSILGKTAVGVAGGVIATGYAAISIGKDAYAEAKEARKVAALTNATLKATGGVANIAAKGVGNLSESIMRKTAIDDEAIQTGANLLLTFKNVRNEAGKGNKIFNEATAAAVDLSAAGFGSIDSSAKMLGKTLNDPIKGITALSRAGVTFTEQQKTKIESLVEENRLLDAQKIILGEVQSQVGGAAAAQADAGDKLGVTIGNIKEDIGTVLMPEVDRFADWLSDKGPAAGRKFSGFLRDDAIPVVRDFAGWLRDDAAPAVGELVDQARPLAKELLPALGDGFGVARDVLKEALPLAKDFVGAFNDMPDWAKKVVVGGVVAGGLASKFGLTGNKPGGVVGSVIASSKPVPVVVTNWAAAGAPGGVVAGPDGKAGKKPRSGVVGGLALIGASLFGDEIIAEVSAEAKWPWTEGPFSAKGREATGLWLRDMGYLNNTNMIAAEGFKTVGNEIERTSGKTRAVRSDFDLLAGTAGRTAGATRVLDQRFRDLPSNVQTILTSLGFKEGKKDAEELKRAIDLLRNKTITITTLRKTVGTGVGPAYNAADDASGGGDETPRRRPREVVPGASGRQVVVINLPDGRQLDGYVDDRINANEGLKGQRR